MGRLFVMNALTTHEYRPGYFFIAIER